MDCVVSQPVRSLSGVIRALAAETRFECTEAASIAFSSIFERQLQRRRDMSRE
jgi:hypothetical protein